MHLDYYLNILQHTVCCIILLDAKCIATYAIRMCINIETLDDYCHYCGMISSHDDQTYLVCT